MKGFHKFDCGIWIGFFTQSQIYPALILRKQTYF